MIGQKTTGVTRTAKNKNQLKRKKYYLKAEPLQEEEAKLVLKLTG